MFTLCTDQTYQGQVSITPSGVGAPGLLACNEGVGWGWMGVDGGGWRWRGVDGIGGGWMELERGGWDPKSKFLMIVIQAEM